ncbi:uncharacterized protein LOC129924233 [Biomphalaria glabrata]|uniref:Uncharacterized protein LOC129924233 n=1 Tax=Biomphalaria glabrata TaxID=6526 RepID=A0A9W2ZGP8_BIOGL|nr:uncharacterized protein LOC129924233 [Biomphalaria glabrata]
MGAGTSVVKATARHQAIEKINTKANKKTKTSTPAVDKNKTSTPVVEKNKTSNPAVEETKTSTPAVEETKTSTPAVVETTAPNHAIQEKAGANQAVEKATHQLSFMDEMNLNRTLPKQSQNIRGKEDANGLQDHSGIRNTPKPLVSSDSNTILPSIILGNLISSEPSIYKEGKIFVGRILLTQYASFQFLQTHLKYLQDLAKEDQCEINLCPDKIQVKLNLSDRITAKEVRAFIDKAMLKIANFLSQFIVLKFEMDGSRLSDFKSFSKGKMSNIFVDYETNEVLAISTKTFKDLENNLNELYTRYLDRGVAETNVEVFRAFSPRFNTNQSAMINKTSSSRSEIVFSSGKHIFVRRFLMKEFYANTKINRDAKFKLYIDRCIIRGTQEAIKRFEEYFNSLLTKINVSEVQVKFFGIQEFLRSYEGQNLLKSIENGNRCIIQLKSDADKKVESLTSVSNQKTSSVGKMN